MLLHYSWSIFKPQNADPNLEILARFFLGVMSAGIVKIVVAGDCFVILQVKHRKIVKGCNSLQPKIIFDV